MELWIEKGLSHTYNHPGKYYEVPTSYTMHHSYTVLVCIQIKCLQGRRDANDAGSPIKQVKLGAMATRAQSQSRLMSWT